MKLTRKPDDLLVLGLNDLANTMDVCRSKS